MLKKLFQSLSFHLFLIISISLASYREMFRMYFFRDDFTLLYQLQQNIPFAYPYMHELGWFIPIYNIFELNPTAYFTYGFIFFLLSAFLFYHLINLLFSKKTLALIGAIIYATAPIGIDSAIEMVIFQPTYFAMSFLLLLLILAQKFYQTQKKMYYLALLSTLLVSLEIVLFKSFFFPIIIILFGIINYDKKKMSIKKFIILQSVIAILWILYMTMRTNFISTPPHRDQSTLFGQLFSNFNLGKVVLNPIITTIDTIFVQNIGGVISPFRHISLFIAALAFSLCVAIKYCKSNKKLVSLYLFSIGFIYINALSFLPLNQNQILEMRNHYMTFSLPAYSLFALTTYLLLTKIFKNKYLKVIPYIFLGIVLATNFVTNQKYLSNFNKRLNYAPQFFKKLKEYVPKLPSHSLIYLKVLNDDDFPENNWRLYDTYAVGALDDRAVYSVTYNLKLSETNPSARTWESVLRFVGNDPRKIQKVFGFEYNLGGLNDITQEVRKDLEETF